MGGFLKEGGENIGGYFRQLEQIYLKQRFSAQGDFCPVNGDIWQYLETFFWIATIRGKVLLLSSKQRPRMVLNNLQYFPDGLDGKESACSARNPRLISGSERSPGGGHGNPLQYPCLENPMDRGALGATVHGVTKSQTRLK